MFFGSGCALLPVILSFKQSFTGPLGTSISICPKPGHAICYRTTVLVIIPRPYVAPDGHDGCFGGIKNPIATYALIRIDQIPTRRWAARASTRACGKPTSASLGHVAVSRPAVRALRTLQVLSSNQVLNAGLDESDFWFELAGELLDDFGHELGVCKLLPLPAKKHVSHSRKGGCRYSGMLTS